MQLVTVEQMKRLEEEAVERGLTYYQMMGNAGKGLADFVLAHYSIENGEIVLGLVGPGNNGGDTLVALTHLKKTGWNTIAYLSQSRGKDDPTMADYLQSGGEISVYSKADCQSNLKSLVNASCIILDGLLGTGIRLPLRGNVLHILQEIKAMDDMPDVIAVDCPSGVDADSGEVDSAVIPARHTVCMAAVKQGLLKFPALTMVGEVHTVDIGLSESLPAWGNVNGSILEASRVAKMLPERQANSHKGSFGTCMIIAGSINYCGAVLLAVESAYRVGVGLVKAAIPGEIHTAIAGELPEATWLLLPGTLGVIDANGADIVLDHLKKTSAILMGPGWGQEDETLHFLNRLLSSENPKGGRQASLGFARLNRAEVMEDLEMPPLVIDADALKLLPRIEKWHLKIPPLSVLTPHPGEMAVLTGLSIEQIQAERVKTACEYAQKWGHVVVLKGAGTIIAQPNGEYSIIPMATSALAKAGTGDVLAGMVVGFLAQGMDAYDAARVAAWIHARAGRDAEEAVGTAASVIARNVIQSIPRVFKQLSGTG